MTTTSSEGETSQVGPPGAKRGLRHELADQGRPVALQVPGEKAARVRRKRGKQDKPDKPSQTDESSTEPNAGYKSSESDDPSKSDRPVEPASVLPSAQNLTSSKGYNVSPANLQSTGLQESATRSTGSTGREGQSRFFQLRRFLLHNRINALHMTSSVT